MLHLLVVAFTMCPSHAVARPRVVSLCLNLLSIARERPTAEVSVRSLAVIAQLRRAAERSLAARPYARRVGHADDEVASGPQDDSALATSLARIDSLRHDLEDSRVRKSVLFVSGPADMREVTGTLARDGGDLDDILDAHMVHATLADPDDHARTAVLEVVPTLSDVFYHRGVGVMVAPGFLNVMEGMADHVPFDLYDLIRAAEHARDLPGGGDLLLFDQFVYRNPPGREYTYVGVVRLRERRVRTHATH